MTETATRQLNKDTAKTECDFAICESRRCLNCKAPQCALGCPIGYDIPKFLQYVKQQNFASALQTVGHLFGEVCGYICARDKQCKGHCVLNKSGCGIDVGAVEKQVFASHFPGILRQDNALEGLKVAVVGAGVSGVTFAAQCFCHGAEVTLLEQNELLHTLKSIPSLRLPGEVLQRVETAVLTSGIRLEHRKIDAKGLTELQQNFDVVYLATGAMKPNDLWIEGEQFATKADSFLRGNTFCDAIIVGGGNTAMDCALLNASKGHKTVVCYRRTRNEMPAFDAEVKLAEKHGVQFMFNLAPLSAKKVGDKLIVTFAKTASENRGNLVVTNQTVELQCNMLVAATGNTFDTSVYDTCKYVQIDNNGNVCGNLYAGGDCTGKGLAVWAVADALNAARAVMEKYKR